MSEDAFIVCERLSKIYGTGEAAVAAIKDVSLRIDAGEYVAITGPSGSGKSTLLQILGLLDQPTNGEYWLAGRRTSHLDDAELSALRGRIIGFVFQSFHLLPRLTLLENVALPLVYQGLDRQARLRQASAALHKVGLADREMHLPHQLSGGQRQRGAIARAIVHRPQIIFADEPTGNLDSKVKEQVLKHLEQLNRELGATLILITHDPEVAEHAPRMLQIQDGRITNEQRRAIT